MLICTRAYRKAASLPQHKTSFSDTVWMRDIAKEPERASCLDITSIWLKECLKNHAKCNQILSSNPSLPTRVLDVSAANAGPRLLVTGGVPGRYVALSYCWGRDASLTLKHANFEQFKVGIALSNFPRTLRDAVVVTRAMGLRYLWIDAVCIIQDSAEDTRSCKDE